MIVLFAIVRFLAVEAKFETMTFVDEAIMQAEKLEPTYREAMPLTGQALALGISWLKEAKRIHLEVPLIPLKTEGEEKPADLLHYGAGLDLPWECTAIEYEHGGAYDVKVDYTRALSTRRIVLCVDVGPGIAPMKDGSADNSDGSLLIWPITYFDEKREWEFCPGVALIPKKQGSGMIEEMGNEWLALARSAERWIGARMSRQEGKLLEMRYQPMMPELFAKLGEEHSTKMMKESCMDAAWVALGSFVAMGCANVFLDSSKGLLSCEMNKGVRSPLDPFRGQKRLSWRGQSRWVQVSTEIIRMA